MLMFLVAVLTFVLSLYTAFMIFWENHIIQYQTWPWPTSSPLFSQAGAVNQNEYRPSFAYITQTEKCLPAHWMANDYLANSSLCNCHVYVISFKEPCDQTNASHIFYLHDKSVGWSGGRNLGYFAARKRGYLYYILFDDDVSLTYNEYTPKEFINNKIAPLQIFTQFLLTDLPAAAAIDFNSLTPANDVRNKWHRECKRTEVPKTIPVYHVDALFNAFHKDVAVYLLPYYEKHDQTSFWLSQVYLMFKFQVVFYGRFEYFPFISCHNPAHRYNITGHFHHLQNLHIRKDMVDTMREQTPAEYKNHPRFLSIMNYDFRSNFAGVLCVNPTKTRTEIVPYENMGPPEII